MKAQIWNTRGWVNETNPDKLKEFYSELLALSQFDILAFSEHHFKPAGWTGLWLLGESHFAIHTWPEDGASYIELSSCNPEYQNYFTSNLPKDFKPGLNLQAIKNQGAPFDEKISYNGKDFLN